MPVTKKYVDEAVKTLDESIMQAVDITVEEAIQRSEAAVDETITSRIAAHDNEPSSHTGMQVAILDAVDEKIGVALAAHEESTGGWASVEELVDAKLAGHRQLHALEDIFGWRGRHLIHHQQTERGTHDHLDGVTLLVWAFVLSVIVGVFGLAVIGGVEVGQWL